MKSIMLNKDNLLTLLETGRLRITNLKIYLDDNACKYIKTNPKEVDEVYEIDENDETVDKILYEINQLIQKYSDYLLEVTDTREKHTILKELMEHELKLYKIKQES